MNLPSAGSVSSLRWDPGGVYSMNMRPGWRATARLLVLAVFLAGGCHQKARESGGREPDPALVPSEIVVLPNDLTLKAGDTVQLSAQVNDGAGQPIGGAPLVFRTSSPSVLRITDHGALTAVGAAGRATVSVSSGSLTRPLRVTVQPGIPARIAILDGDQQQATVGTSLPKLIAARINDSFGNAVSGVAVRFALAPGQGSIQPAASTTDAEGRASAAWTLGTAVGQQIAQVRIDSSDVIADVTATALPGPPQKLDRVGEADGAVAAGDTVTLRAHVQDAYGNSTPEAGVEWRIVEGSGTLAATNSRADASGIVQVQLTTAPKTGRTIATATLSGEAGGRASPPPVRFIIDTRPGPAASLAIRAGDNQKARAGRAVKVPPAVVVLDANGNPVSGAIVQFEVSAGGGTVEGASQATDKEGVARVQSWIVGPPATASAGESAPAERAAATAEVPQDPAAPAADNELTASVDGVDESVIFHASTLPD